MTVTALGMGAIAWLAARALEESLGTRGILAQAATALVPVGVGIAAYFAGTKLLGLSEAQRIVSAITRYLVGARDRMLA
jgi:hypothetical protein